jgi:hypothetical protein
VGEAGGTIWLIVTVCPAIVSVPVRGVADGFAATV